VVAREKCGKKTKELQFTEGCVGLCDGSSHHSQESLNTMNSMLKNRFGWSMSLLTSAAAMLAFASCSSESSQSAKSARATSTTIAVEKGVPGGVVVETHEITARVVEIDKGTRKVMFEMPDGKKTVVKCGPEVVNFEQIHAGDVLKATVADELAVSMDTGTAASGEGAGALVALAPKGSKPGGVIAQAVQVTATVSAIDLAAHKATLQFQDGTTHTVAVRPDVDLTQRKVGEKVVIRVTEAVAFSMAKP
jgi:hypothetical protein